MKKTFFVIIVTGALFTGACSTDVDDSTTTVEYPTSNLVTSLVTGESFAGSGSYKFYFNLTQGKVSVSTDNLMINNATHSILTDTVAYAGYIVNTEQGSGSLQIIKGLTGYMDRDRSMPVKDADFSITSLFYHNNVSTPGLNVAENPYPRVVAKYYIGDEWEVRTFSNDALYVGKTLTSYPGSDGQPKTYESTGMTYRVVIDIAKNKAAMVIYNAKFSDSEKEPVKTMILLEDLDVEWRADGYAITGSDIIPQIPESNLLTPYPDYVFNALSFVSSNDDLTEAEIAYTVAGIYNGQFSGTYVLEVPLDSK